MHTESNSFLNSYNPLLQSGLSVNLSQPLVRDLSIDFARQQLATTRVNRDIAGTKLQESVVHTTASVKTAYWNFAAANGNLEARQTALDLARELVRVNKARVDVGQAPPLDLVSAQAEVASNEEQLIVAQTLVKIAEDRLRVLILDTTDPDSWTVAIQTIDSPPINIVPIDLDASRRRRTARSHRSPAWEVRHREHSNERQVCGEPAAARCAPERKLSGERPRWDGGHPIGRVSRHDHWLWVGDRFRKRAEPALRAELPNVGRRFQRLVSARQERAEEANYARAQLEKTQAQERLKATQSRVVQQLREAAWKIEGNAKRIDTTRAAHEAGRAAPRRRTEAARSGAVHQLPRHPGPA